MKATIELPDALYREIRIRAAQEGRKVKDLVAELLMHGMYGQGKEPTPLKKPVVAISPITGLPMILGDRSISRSQELTPERVAEISIQQDAEWALEAGR